MALRSPSLLFRFLENVFRTYHRLKSLPTNQPCHSILKHFSWPNLISFLLGAFFVLGIQSISPGSVNTKHLIQISPIEWHNILKVASFCQNIIGPYTEQHETFLTIVDALTDSPDGGSRKSFRWPTRDEMQTMVEEISTLKTVNRAILTEKEKVEKELEKEMHEKSDFWEKFMFAERDKESLANQAKGLKKENSKLLDKIQALEKEVVTLNAALKENEIMELKVQGLIHERDQLAHQVQLNSQHRRDLRSEKVEKGGPLKTNPIAKEMAEMISTKPKQAIYMKLTNQKTAVLGQMYLGATDAEKMKSIESKSVSSVGKNKESGIVSPFPDNVKSS